MPSAVLMLVACVAPPPDGKGVVLQVFAAWEARRAAVKTVRYVVAGETVFPWPKGDLITPERATVLLDFTGQRFRMEWEQSFPKAYTDGLTTRRTLRTFDGVAHWNVLPEDAKGSPGQPDVRVMTGNLREAGFTVEEWPFFIAHGYVPALAQNIRPGRFLPPLHLDEFSFHARAEYAGRSCVVLRRKAGRHFDEYWVDLARGGVVLRYRFHTDGRPQIELDLRYDDRAAGPTLAGWTRNPHLSVPRTHRLRVLDYFPRVAVSADDFQPALRPGMRVMRTRRGGDPDVAAAGIAPTLSEERLVVAADGSLTPDRGPPSRWRWLLPAGGVLAVALAIGWWWRARVAAREAAR